MNRVINSPLKSCKTFSYKSNTWQTKNLLKEKTEETMLSLDIKNISIWSKIQGFMKINQPDKAAVSYVCNLFNNNFLPHF